MTGWHVDDETLRRYVERTDSMAEGASVEQHLLTCAPCRARVNTAATAVDLAVVDLAAVWDRTRDAVEVPRPSVFERLLRAAGLPAHEARLVAVASAFRGVWLIGVAAVLAFAALAAAIGHARGLWFFLAVAPRRALPAGRVQLRPADGPGPRTGDGHALPALCASSCCARSRYSRSRCRPCCCSGWSCRAGRRSPGCCRRSGSSRWCWPRPPGSAR